MQPAILISFDVEEFDIPLEYQCAIPMEQQMAIGKRGLDAVLPVLEQHGVRGTMFTTANFADCFPEAVQQMAAQHEIASHTYYHSRFDNKDLLASRLRLEALSGQTVVGLRMPRMRFVEMSEVKKAGYQYDSSINPTWIPGRYNNLRLSRTVYVEEGVPRLPASVSPNLRIPLFWLGFKNYPYAVFKRLCLQTLQKDGYLCLYFHPWEFTGINGFNLPGYVKRHHGQPLLNRLNQLLQDIAPHGRFMPVNAYLEAKNLIRPIQA